ncbi:MAG: tyrosine-type recombinase/integrase [Alphaproteobacteria bacterium]
MGDIVIHHETLLPRRAENIRRYLESSLSENTRTAYKSDLQHFKTCGGDIPCSPEMLAAYLTDHAESLSMATLSRRVIAISKAHTVKGYPDPRTDLVRLTLKGIKRTHGKPQRQAAPILKEDLTVMLSHAPDNLKGYRDKALLILGFCAALRRSELCAVRVEDLEFTAQGLILTLPRSKTDVLGKGRKIGIPFGRGRICPVTLVRLWREQSSIENGPLFVSIRKGGKPTGEQLSDRSIANIIKHYAEKAGLSPDKYSGHSLRSGLCTSAAQHGVSSWKIRAQTGHRSDSMLARYIRDGDIFTDNAAGAIF